MAAGFFLGEAEKRGFPVPWPYIAETPVDHSRVTSDWSKAAFFPFSAGARK